MTIFAKAFLCRGEVGPEEMKRRLASVNPGALVQAVSRDSARNENLLEMLAAQTFEAEASGSMLAKKPEIDFLLRVAGSTQISRAIAAKGAKEGEPFLLVAAGKSEVEVLPELQGLELTRRSLSGAELAAVEHGALLSARRA